MSNITLAAIDLAKETFQLRAVNHKGTALINRKLNRSSLLREVSKLPAGICIAMEACGTAHYWGRRFEAAGFKVQLIAPQYVKPFVKTQKNDSADAEGIAEAASRSNMRFVPVKSLEQQDIQSIHRVRERYMKNRTALMNELRGLLLEYGVAIPKGESALMKAIPACLQLATVTEGMSLLANELCEELTELNKRITRITKRINAVAAQQGICKRLMTIPGIAEISATALYAAVGNMNFKNGRELSAYLGLVPRQRSTGGKEKLGRITKAGNVYVRKLLVHGARSVLQNSHRYTDRYNSWAKTMRTTKGYTKGSVALANRNARIAWAVMKSDASFRHDFIPTIEPRITMH